jgi:hypothetical protein
MTAKEQELYKRVQWLIDKGYTSGSLEEVVNRLKSLDK